MSSTRGTHLTRRICVRPHPASPPSPLSRVLCLLAWRTSSMCGANGAALLRLHRSGRRSSDMAQFASSAAPCLQMGHGIPSSEIRHDWSGPTVDGLPTFNQPNAIDSVHPATTSPTSLLSKRKWCVFCGCGLGPRPQQTQPPKISLPARCVEPCGPGGRTDVL